MTQRRRLGGALVGALLAGSLLAKGNGQWSPQAWTGESTVELCTTDPGEPAHCFPVWFVVLDGQMYVRLGGRASGRFERSTTRPFLGVRIAGERFEHVRGTPVPEDAARVAEAMGTKYWSDVLVRYVSHPLTLRLAPE